MHTEQNEQPVLNEQPVHKEQPVQKKHSVHQAEESGIRKRYRIVLLILLFVLIFGTFLSFLVGYYPLTLSEVVKAFATGFGYQGDVSQQAVTIFWNIRLPRIMSAILIGASLSVAGSVFQGMFRNPLVSPDILGVSSGASLGAAIAILGGTTALLIQVSAFIGGIAAVSAAYLISRKSPHPQTLSLVLTGAMIMALGNAGVTMVKYVANPNDVLPQLTFWLMGSLAKTNMQSLGWSSIPMLTGLVAVFILRWRINLLTLDEEEAKSLGVNIRLYRILFIIASTLLSAAAVCLGGLIGWVGLMMPHIGRALVGPCYRRLIPACMMLGAIYLVLMDSIARSVLSSELPLGVVTSVMGAPFFVYLIIKKRGA